MYLLSSWKDSLKIFLPQNFKVFFLVTLKSVGETYKVWLKNFWWLLLVYPVGVLIVKSIKYLPETNFLGGETLGFLVILEELFHPTLYSKFWLVFASIITILGFLIQVTIVLAIRPSVPLKNIRYFWGYKKHIFYAFLWSISLAAFVSFFMLILWFLLMSRAFILLYTMVSLIFLVQVLFLLFLFDSDARWESVVRSVGHAINMFFYNLPFFLVLMGLIAFQVFLIMRIGYSGLLVIAAFIAEIIFILLNGCFISNFYIKRVREQFSLYFNVPGQ